MKSSGPCEGSKETEAISAFLFIRDDSLIISAIRCTTALPEGLTEIEVSLLNLESLILPLLCSPGAEVMPAGWAAGVVLAF